MRFQPIYDIAEICSSKGLREAVLCPGSRCAPLTLAFTRHPRINTRTFSDERSAAFIALGMAQQNLTPTILLCTSGTAAYNFAPAVAEAFFSQTPLIIFTADRPSEWIAQHDGQTIYQSGIFGSHVKKSFQLPQEYEHKDDYWAINRMVNDAINLSVQEPRGPVHINAPFREPLYPSANDRIGFSGNVRITKALQQNFTLTSDQKNLLRKDLLNYNRILIAAGQHDYDHLLIQSLTAFSSTHNIPVVGDIISNLHAMDKLVRHTDVFLGQASVDIKKKLQPDLLISFGKSVISKNLKLFLREYKPEAHWHIQAAGNATDTFQSVTQVIPVHASQFFSFLNETAPYEISGDENQKDYCQLWEAEEKRSLQIVSGFFPQPGVVELDLVSEILKHLPEKCNLHLANSMSVRYANFIGLTAQQKGVRVFANRGTSGIDGCTSTAVGHSLVSEHPHVLITGDLAFFYDRNAFWHNYSLPNLRVVLLNNHGGIIFGMIDGPASLPEAQEYFITQQKLNAKKLCEEFGYEYLRLDDRAKLEYLLKEFFDSDGKTKILELETNIALNKETFNRLKESVKKSFAKSSDHFFL